MARAIILSRPSQWTRIVRWSSDWMENVAERVIDGLERGEKMEDVTEAARRQISKSNYKVKLRTLRRKLLKDETEACVMSWNARRQLLYLLRTYEAEPFDEEFLASVFPITVAGIKKLASNRNEGFQPAMREQHKLRINSAAIERWNLILDCLKSLSKEPAQSVAEVNALIASLPENLLWIFAQSKLHLLKNADGNPDLPSPQPLDVPEKRKEKEQVPGSFRELVHGFCNGFEPDLQSNQVVLQSKEIEKCIALFQRIPDSTAVGPVSNQPLSTAQLRSLLHISKLLTRRQVCTKPLALPNKVNLQFSDTFKYKL
ncbi:hypothetical protein CSKR_101318 [Clonorchis sinensis]|uniref:Uncharacterized protein n=1 Tax=Clonorchis sinensis TaxID=79923 RepID=A0A8T1MFC2_CLOSI|nr:hypothetical protein CSKR_101318 [Clonorchis sinensis]